MEMNTFYEHFIDFLCKINAELFFETNNLNKFANFLQITNNLNYLQYLQLIIFNKCSFISIFYINNYQ